MGQPPSLPKKRTLSGHFSALRPIGSVADSTRPPSVAMRSARDSHDSVDRHFGIVIDSIVEPSARNAFHVIALSVAVSVAKPCTLSRFAMYGCVAWNG